MPSTIPQWAVYDPALSNINGNAGSPTQMAVGYPGPVSAGSALVVLATCSNQVGNVVGPMSDSKSQTWPAFLESLSTGPGGSNARLFYMPNTVAMTAGYSSYATSSTTTTITDTRSVVTPNGPPWSTDQWKNFPIIDRSTGNTGTVTGNTANTLTFTALPSAPNVYCVGDYLLCQNVDDYQGLIALEVRGVTTSPLIDHSSNAATVASGTDNITSGTKALGSSPCIVIGFCSDDSQTNSPNLPNAGSTASSISTFWSWDIGTVQARAQSQNYTNPGTVGSLFSSPASNHYQTFMIALLDSPPDTLLSQICL